MELRKPGRYQAKEAADLPVKTAQFVITLLLKFDDMKNSLLFSLVFILLISCNRVPLTGRKQMNLIPSSQMNSLSSQSYREILQQSNVVTSTQEARMVQQVGSRIKNSVEKYLTENNKSEYVENFDWTFNLIKNEQVNAFCMPGGRVVFYSGILPICQDEAGVAVVMGHEVAHAIAKHGNERMSQALLQQLGGVALSVALREKPEQTQNLFYAAYGVGTQVGVMLPFSRLHETEADKLGLIFMAMAGYDPREAPQFWSRMKEQAGGQSPPEFLSTHPSHESRIETLNKFMPKALKYYNP